MPLVLRIRDQLALAASSRSISVREDRSTSNNRTGPSYRVSVDASR